MTDLAPLHRRPLLALTPGEPAGIGPDIALLAAAQFRPAQLVLVADPDLLRARAAALGLALTVVEYRPGEPLPGPGSVACLAVSLPVPVAPGVLDPAVAGYVLATLDAAIDATLRGEFLALVTGPVHKANINAAGIPFTGHTEYLAQRTGGDPVMLLAAPGIRVALATTHLPLAAVPGALSAAGVERVLRVLHADLGHRFGIASPRILVCGINPHAGEDGHLGREEVEWLIPCLERLRAEGMRLDGPHPADTAFVPEQREQSDAILAMYHDQGLAPLKALGFGQAVNITLGLPIVRTSVDHGTALGLAGTGRARHQSLIAAAEQALAMTARMGARRSA